MENHTEKNNTKEALKKTTAMNLWLRIFVGGFLVYLAYTLVADMGDVAGTDRVVFTIAGAVFAIAGAGIALWSGYRLVKKEYYDPLSEEDSQNND